MSNLLRFPHLHCLVYIVADKPTKDNISQDVPLVGTDSYKTLLTWLGEMDVDVSRVRLYNQSTSPFSSTTARLSLNKAIEASQIRVIALGQKAATYLVKTGIVEYFVLPHPSGRNLLTNDKNFVKVKLAACKNYIYEGDTNEQQSTKESTGVASEGPQPQAEGTVPTSESP